MAMGGKGKIHPLVEQIRGLQHQIHQRQKRRTKQSGRVLCLSHYQLATAQMVYNVIGRGCVIQQIAHYRQRQSQPAEIHIAHCSCRKTAHRQTDCRGKSCHDIRHRRVDGKREILTEDSRGQEASLSLGVAQLANTARRGSVSQGIV